MIPKRCFGDDKEIMLARGEINVLDLDPTFLASSLAALLRLGASLTARIPWSVQLIVNMNVGMSSSMGYTSRLLAARAAGRPALC